MTKLTKHVGLLLALVLLASTILVGCGTPEETSVPATATTAAGESATATSVPDESEEFVFGVVLVGPANDHGYSQAHAEAAAYVEEQIPGTRAIILESLNTSDRPDTTLEQVVDEMVSQGAQLIFTTSDDFSADTTAVATKYPDVEFVQCTGDQVLTGEASENLSNFMGQMIYMKAIAGCAAALKTETDTIGYLGPLVNDETRRLVSASYLGCKECYERYRDGDAEDLTFIVNWIGFWFNIPGVTLDPTDVANDLFNNGVDVLLSGIDTTEAIVVAGQRYEQGEQVWAIPYDYVGACDVYPEVCLGTPYFNWGPDYVDFVTRAMNGELEQVWEWNAPNWDDINDTTVSPVGYDFGAGLSDEDIANLNDFIADLASGEFQLFEGPLYLQDGTLYVAEGEVATEEQIWYLPQLLQGMDGASN